MLLHSINPATGEVLRSVPSLTEEGLQARLAQAAAAVRVLGATPMDLRSMYLRKLAVLLERESEELARLISVESGKPVRWSRVEVSRCAALCHYYADHGARLLAPEPLQTVRGPAYVQWGPIGMVLGVTPGESPLWHAFRFAVPNLIAGNVVLLKMAASVPQCTLAVEALARRAGFERGALTALLLADRQTDLVLKDERAAAVSVTGTEPTGRALAAQAGWLLKRSAMHLNSSDAMVVMPSCDMDDAVRAAARAMTGVDGAGAAKRIVVHADVYTEFAQALLTLTEAMLIGDPLKDETEVGPLSSAEALKTLTEQVDAAVTVGGRILSGGAPMLGGKGHFFEPTLLSDVPRTAAVARDAFAGPVALLFRARNAGDAIAIANGTSFGMAASVWTAEPAEQQVLLQGVDAGTVALNALPGFDPRLPVGGSKRSGYGHELGLAGMREFLQAKTITLAG